GFAGGGGGGECVGGGAVDGRCRGGGGGGWACAGGEREPSGGGPSQPLGAAAAETASQAVPVAERAQVASPSSFGCYQLWLMSAPFPPGPFPEDLHLLARRAGRLQG